MTKHLLRAFLCFSLVVNAYSQCLGEPTKRVNCTTIDTASFDVLRVHVRCSNKPDNFEFFAVPIDALGAATRLTDAGIAAMENPGWTLFLDYCPNDLSGATIGCDPVNCRLVKVFGVVKP